MANKVTKKASKKKEVVLSEREQRLKLICDTINKTAFGGSNKDALTYLGSRDSIQMERWSSGDPGLDDALGGGWPRGRFIELFGPESGGKSTLVLHAIAEFQSKYPQEDCALIDTEFSFDEFYARRIGVDTKFLMVHQPDSGEQALNILKLLIQNGVKLIAVDSVAALTTKAELEGDIGDQHIGQQARLMSGALRQLAAEAGRHDATVFWTNQVRDKIGVMWGDRTTTPAGRALPHYASIRCNISAIGKVREKVKGEDVVVSSKNKVTVRKNKTAAPFKTAEFCISFGYGIDAVAGILDSAIEHKIIIKKGAWFSFKGDKDNIGQGRAGVLKRLRKEKDLFDEVKSKLSEARKAGIEAEIGGDVEVIDASSSLDPHGIDSIDVDDIDDIDDIDDVDDVDDVDNVDDTIVEDV